MSKHAPAFRGYTIGELPADLGRRIAEAHAAAIKQANERGPAELTGQGLEEESRDGTTHPTQSA